MSKKLVLSVLIFILSFTLSAQPSISSFSPLSGPVGTVVTINGANFSTVTSNNIVYFGKVKATVTASNTTTLKVTVPAGASYQPFTVTVNGLMAYSVRPFAVTFSEGVLTSGSFTYADSLDNVTNSETNNIVEGDFDDDGKVDIATVDRLNDQLLIYKNTSAGTNFSFSAAVSFATGTQPVSLACGDLDGDGRLDLAVVNKNDNTVSLFRNTGSTGIISFAAKIDYATAAQPLDIVLSDFDGDGKTDIATGNGALLPASISVLHNIGSTGSISFAPKKDIPVLFGGSEIAAGDLNGDRKPEIVVVSNAANIMSVVTNTSSVGSISFTAATDYPTGITPVGLVIGDLDGDNKADIVLANFFSSTISVFRNVSSGTTSLATRQDINVPGADDIAIVDADGDGKPDLAVQTFSPSGFSVLKNNSSLGSISLGSPIAYPSICSDNIIAADLNGDGKSDIAVGCGVWKAGIWKNKTTEPQITSFTPATAAEGETVTINGANFSGTTAVLFGDVAAASFSVINATTVKAVVGTGASGDITILSPSGSSVMSGFIFSAPPVINSFNPKTAAAGEMVTITGTNFTSATAVTFGGVAAASFTVVNATTITATVGAGASGNVSVTTPFGTATSSGFTFFAPPTLTSFTPTFGGTGAIIHITGTNFTGATAVSFGGVPASSFSILSSTLITAVVGGGASGEVSITTPFGTATRSGFLYIPPPVITSFTPKSAKYGTSVTITGTNLETVTGVSFGGVPALSFRIVNASTIMAEVGNGVSGNVVVTSNYGSSSLPDFTYLPPPIVESFSPQSGSIGTTVTIMGRNFTGATAVYFNGEPAASFTVNSSTTIQAVTGLGNTGSVQVTTPNGFGVSNEYYTFIYPEPTITSFTPASATTGATVSITGTNFIKIHSVRFGDVSASSFVVNSSTSITAQVGAGATGNITVTGAGGQATSAGFTFLQPPPIISSFYPMYAASGSSVTITGNHFQNANTVKFGGVDASSFIVNSNTSITAIVGEGASGNITVTTPGGTTNASNFNYDAPQITSFSPTSGGTGTEITITGSGFYNVSAVRFGGVNASSFRVNSLSSITAVVGSGNAGDVTVTTQTATARLGDFTYVTSPPYIRSVAPFVATAGMTVKIKGYKFNGATEVRFGDIPAASFVVNSDTEITAVVASGASGGVLVNTPAGSVNYPGFTYTTAPVIKSILPEAAPVGATVTISGYNFSSQPSDNLVFFGAVKAPVLSASLTTLVVAVPQGATYQPITVTSKGLTVYSSKAFNVTFSSLGTLNANSFVSVIDSTVGSIARDVALADIDNDGKTDLAVSGGTFSGPQLYLFKNESTPSVFSLAHRKHINSNYGPAQTAFGDVDGDGKLDMVVANVVDIYGVSVFRNTSVGGGGLSFANDYTFNNLRLSGFHVALGDLDGDGKVDLAVSSQNSREVSIYKNQSRIGSISFAAPIKKQVTGYLEQIGIADLDQDSKPDLVIATVEGNTSQNGSLQILRNTSTATALSFDAAVGFTTSGGSGSLAIVDLDGDSRNDVVVTNQYVNTVSVFRNSSTPGNIVLANKMEFITGKNPTGVCVADLDGNNKPDLVIANSSSATISIFENTTADNVISFASRFEIAAGNSPNRVVAGDMNADGKPDIVLGNLHAGSVSVIKNLLDGYFVSSFTPVTGTTGTSVTIKGTHFTGATAVTFGGEAASSFSVLNDTTITAIIGNGGSGSVEVTSPFATAALPGFVYVVPVPAISAFTPVSGTTGTSVGITGTDFTGATGVSFGGVPAQSFTVNSPTSITAIVGTGATGNVDVTTPGGTATLAGFTFNIVTSVGNPVVSNSRQLAVNPNPGSGLILVKHPASSKTVQILFIDLLGRVMKKVIPARNANETMVNVTGIPLGVYQILWSDGSQKLSQTFILQEK